MAITDTEANAMKGKDQRVAEIERGGRDHHRRDEHQREGIFDAAGEIEKGRKLHHVIGEIDRGLAVGEPMGGGIADGERDVENSTRRDGGGATHQRQMIAKAEMHHEQRGRLARHRQPAQVRQRAQPHPAAAQRGRRHPRLQALAQARPCKTRAQGNIRHLVSHIRGETIRRFARPSHEVYQ